MSVYLFFLGFLVIYSFVLRGILDCKRLFVSSSDRCERLCRRACSKAIALRKDGVAKERDETEKRRPSSQRGMGVTVGGVWMWVR
jgi:hypothetical protein